MKYSDLQGKCNTSSNDKTEFISVLMTEVAAETVNQTQSDQANYQGTIQIGIPTYYFILTS